MAEKFKPVVMRHKDGSVRRATSPAEKVRAEFDGFRVDEKKAPKPPTGGAQTSSTPDKK